MILFKFELGDPVRDIVNGYSGRITARAQYDFGEPVRYLVESIDQTGRAIKWWITEERLVSIYD